jgi:hypothetical protein
MGMEATSFSEQAPAARRDYFAGSNSGLWARMFAMSGDVVEKFTATPGGAAGTSRPEHRSRSGGPPFGRLQSRPLLTAPFRRRRR